MKVRPEESENEAQEERSERRRQQGDRITPHRLYLALIGCIGSDDDDEGEEEEE
jgi:hypothetical protein